MSSTNTAFFVKLQGELLGSQVFENEVFRIGGLRSIRGFDENSLLVTGYLAAFPELRVFAGGGTLFKVFSDVSAVRKYLSLNQTDWNLLMSFGLASAFRIQSGIFEVAFANGLPSINQFSFQNTKVHFGYKLEF